MSVIPPSHTIRIVEAAVRKSGSPEGGAKLAAHTLAQLSLGADALALSVPGKHIAVAPGQIPIVTSWAGSPDGLARVTTTHVALKVANGKVWLQGLALRPGEAEPSWLTIRVPPEFPIMTNVNPKSEGSGAVLETAMSALLRDLDQRV